MIRIQEIQKALGTVVGWRQAYNPSQYVEEALTRSESGLYFQDAHPLMTIDNMAAIMPDDYGMQYPAWDADQTYITGAKVTHDGHVWKAKRENKGEEPQGSDFNGDFSSDFGNAYWSVFNPLSDFLRTATEAGIAQAVQTFIQMKQLTEETRNLMERRTFFDGAGRLAATLQNTGKLVGFEIVPVRSMGVTTRIEKVGLQMFGATGFVRLYLFHSSHSKPMKYKDVYIDKGNGAFKWFDLNWDLPYISNGNDSGGAWYIVYNQNDLPMGMEAVNISKDWSREPCGTCNMGSIETWREITKYMQVSPCAHVAPDGFREDPTLWDIADTAYTNTVNYGLNCEVTVGCDLTDFIISQRQIFQTVIQRQVSYNALRTLAMNPNVRVNRNQSNATRTDILYELDGNTIGRKTGLGYELEKAYEALSLDTRDLDRVCLKCNNHGVKYRTAF